MPSLRLRDYRPAWASHIIVLMKILEISDGPVLEMGIGAFSTPLLHEVCFKKKRGLISYESDPNYVHSHRGFNTPEHKIILVENYDQAPIEKDWGMVFIDHGPGERRIVDIRRVAPFAQFVVVHDTERGGRDFYYKDGELDMLFKYRIDYVDRSPNTSVLSNFIDVTKLII